MSRDVMKLALEALQDARQAIIALRKALAEQPARPYRLLQDNGSKYFGESWEKAEQPAQQALDKMADNAKELGLDYEPATYAFKTTSAPVFAFDTKPNHNITFHNQDGKQIGVLNFNGPEMTFVGDADESAKVFFDWIAESFKERLEQERADEREAISDEWSMCVQSDLEHGVKSLNEQAAKEWFKNYREISKFGAWLEARSKT